MGNPLGPELEGLWSARRGSYRVIYRIDEGERLVQIVTIDTGLTSIVGLAEANGAAYDGQSRVRVTKTAAHQYDWYSKSGLLTKRSLRHVVGTACARSKAEADGAGVWRLSPRGPR